MAKSNPHPSYPKANSLIQNVIQPNIKDLGALTVRRSLPQPTVRAVGPFVFFDEIGPALLSKTENVDVRPHPHINLATITYLFDGDLHHRDSLGTSRIISPGAVNLMVAGHGIVHSERTPAKLRNVSKSLHGLQLWIALADAYEEVEPAFFHYPSTSIPQWTKDGTELRLLMGSIGEYSSPVRTYSPTLYAVGRSQEGSSLELPIAQERAIYIISGSLTISEAIYRRGMMIVLCPDTSISAVCCEGPCVWVVIGGDSVGPRHLFWNFVSSRHDRIEQAKNLWRNDGFPKITGDDQERIPLPI